MKHEELRVAVAVAIVAAGVSAATAQTASPIVVNAGGSLQAALNQAQPGQVIEVQAGATFDGNFILPVKTGTGYITVRTSTTDAQLPGATTRIDPAHESLLPTLRSLNTIPALRTAAGARHWRPLRVYPPWLWRLRGLPDRLGLLDLDLGVAACNRARLRRRNDEPLPSAAR